MKIDASNLRLLEKKKIADGGEGIICDYNKDIVAKMFLPHVNMQSKEQKVKAFIELGKTANIPDNVKLPLDSLEVDGHFKGYLMGKVIDGEPVYYLTKTKQLALLNFNNRDILEILLDLWNTVEIIHHNSIIIGDVSGYNFLLSKRQVHFIDTESWGILNRFIPDAYTEMYTDPLAIQARGLNHSFESDLYALSVLTFELLTRIHPFGGTYNKDKSMKIPERAKNKLSLLGCHDIKIPNKIQSWVWMGPQLLDAFKNVFEGNLRISLLPQLYNLYQNMAFCSDHNTYYYNQYTNCPLCDDTASIYVPVITKPVVASVKDIGVSALTVLFDGGRDVAIMLGKDFYFSIDNHIVDVNSGMRKYFTGNNRSRMGFFDNGKRYYYAEDQAIYLYNTEDDKLLGKIEKSPSSMFTFNDNCLYYIDISENLNRVEITDVGNRKQTLVSTYHAIFDADKEGGIFLVSRYPDKLIIEVNGFTHKINYTSAINEYGMSYDRTTKQWLFIFKEPNGGFRTIVFKDTIVYDTSSINYEASTLSNIDFCAGTVFEPVSGAIRGTNLAKNTVKEFTCNVVSGDSSLEFNNGKFIIVNNDKSYTFG